MNSIRPLAGDNSLEEFVSALYEQEFSARRVWQTMGNHRQFGGHMAVLISEGRNMARTIGDRLPAITTSTREPSRSARLGASTSRQLPYPKKRKRNCRHCGQPHWDFECPTRKPVKTYLIQSYEDDEDTLMELENQELDLFDEWQKARAEPEEDPNQIIEESENGHQSY